MNANPNSLGQRLLAVDPLSPDSRQQLEQELSHMFQRELTTTQRIFFGAVCEALKPGSTTNRRFAPQNSRPVKDQFARLHVRVGTLEELPPVLSKRIGF